MINQTTVLLDTLELIKLFVSASLKADVYALEQLLSEDGVFEIEDMNLELVDTSKKEFIQWYNNKLQETKLTELVYDQCIGCSFGKQVVIFNNGTFPREPQEFTDKTKAGLMLDTSECKISKIQFCFTFLKTENRAVCECVGDELLKYIKAGFSEEDAIALYDANPDSEYSYITKKINEEEEEGLPF
jgi:hypothetical protein